MWDFFDQILYINLDERKDRKKSILQQLQNLEVPANKITRVRAHSCINPTRGCTLSHIRALDWALEFATNSKNRFLILEDDAYFLDGKQGVYTYIKNFEEFSKKQPWDIFFLGTNPYFVEETTDCNIKRVIASCCAHAYCLEARYIPTLREVFVESYKQLWHRTSLQESIFYAIDRMWVELQLKDYWFVGKKTLVRQGPFYSDIELKFRDRTPRSLSSEN